MPLPPRPSTRPEADRRRPVPVSAAQGAPSPVAARLPSCGSYCCGRSPAPESTSKMTYHRQPVVMAPVGSPWPCRSVHGPRPRPHPIAVSPPPFQGRPDMDGGEIGRKLERRVMGQLLPYGSRRHDHGCAPEVVARFGMTSRRLLHVSIPSARRAIVGRNDSLSNPPVQR